MKVRLEARSGVLAVTPMAVCGLAKLGGRGAPASFCKAGFGFVNQGKGFKPFILPPPYEEIIIRIDGYRNAISICPE
mgnify:CR=1 FL=1